MPFIQLNDKQFPLRSGDVRVGTGPDADIRLPGPEAPEAHAVVTLAEDGSVIVRRGSAAAVVKVNGVQLGAEPSPLIHGDKLEIGGAELTFGDDSKAGSTKYFAAMSVPEALEGAPARTNRPTAGTGGRLVSLVDGREYFVGSTGLVIGRDPGCDVVVPSSEVSRRHAEITSRADGYVVSDMSTNGLLVNGERVQQSRVLARADVIKVGNEEFRFYADAAEAASEPARKAAPRPSLASASPVAFAPTPPTPSAAAELEDALRNMESAGPRAARGSGGTAVIAPLARSASAPARPQAAAAAAAGLAPQGAPASDGPVLAALEVLGGVLKGTRYELRRAPSHIGRGAHNDVQVPDDSVSDSHAKIERRDGRWLVVDMTSTNGTYVGGRRIVGEAPLAGAADVRFGGVKMRFEPADAGPDEVPGAAPAASPEPDAPRGAAPAVWVVVALLILAAAFYFLGR